jgi:hypothetical protein
MRALTLRSEWAWAVRFAGKRIENRTWAPPIDGERIFLHAGRARPTWRPVLERARLAGVEVEPGSPPRVAGEETALLQGVIFAISTVRLADPSEDDPWRVEGLFAWRLDDLTWTSPVEQVGQLRLWWPGTDPTRL